MTKSGVRMEGTTFCGKKHCKHDKKKNSLTYVVPWMYAKDNACPVNDDNLVYVRVLVSFLMCMKQEDSLQIPTKWF